MTEFYCRYWSEINPSFSVCPECGKEMILLPHRFRPPKKTDEEKWKTVKFLIENGFYYQHVYKDRRYIKLDVHENYISYPETLKEAKEFVEKYRDQARKKSSFFRSKLKNGLGVLSQLSQL